MKLLGIWVTLSFLTCAVFASGCSEPRQAPTRNPYIVKNIKVVWQRYVKEGNTCTRCDKTGENVEKAVHELRSELLPHGVKITMVRKALNEDKITESNTVLINGRPVENIVPGVRVFTNICGSCCEMTGKETTKCRAIEYQGKQYTELPLQLIRWAILAVAKDLPQPPSVVQPPEPSPG